jgi:hypothetical protein
VKTYGLTIAITLLLIVGATSCIRTKEKTVSPPIFDKYGVLSLREMGYGDQLLAKGAYLTKIKRDNIEYRLPAGAKQGAPDWYMLKLHYSLVLSPRSGSGIVYLTASTNGRAAAMITFDVNKRGEKLKVTRSDLGLVSGNRKQASAKRVWNGAFTNYLQYKGVREGMNSLTFKFLQLGSARIDSWKIYSDTGIVRTRNGPSRIELIPSIGERRIVVGDRFRVGFRIQNTSRTPVPAGGRVTLRVSTKSALAVIGSDSTRLRSISGRRSVSGSFLLEARKAGSIPITLGASSWGGSPLVRLAVQVRRR